jgi:hypothetical protein
MTVTTNGAKRAVDRLAVEEPEQPLEELAAAQAANG